MSMNKQAIFDKVAIHLLTQMRRCEDSGSCLYRGPKDMACAIGSLIPNRLYRDTMEGQGAAGMLADHPKVASFLGIRLRGIDGVTRAVDSPKLRLINELQDVHDDFTPQEWRRELIRRVRATGVQR